MHQVLEVQEIAVTLAPDVLSSGGAGNLVHAPPCNRAAQMYVSLPWWFQPRETQTGPATHDVASMSPPTASDGSGSVNAPVETAASAEFDKGATDTAMKLAAATVAAKSTAQVCRFMRSLYRRRIARI